MDREHYDGGTRNWANYYWFYYKWHIIIGLVMIIGIVICTVQCANKVDPDYYMVLFSDTFVSDEDLGGVTDKFAEFAIDKNEDGEIRIQGINCTYPKSDTSGLKSTANQKGVLQVANDDTPLWLLDEKGIMIYYSSQEIDIFAKWEKFDEYDSHAINIKNTTIYKDIKEFLPENEEYYLFCKKTANDNPNCNEYGLKILEQIVE